MKQLFLALCFLSFSVGSSAGILVEPKIGYAFGGFSQGSLEKGRLDGLSYGGRFGVDYLGLMAGLDIERADHLTYDQGSVGTWGNARFRQRDYAAFVGINFPILLRVWAGYNFSARMTDITNAKTYKGSGLKLGLGLTPLPMLSVNLEYTRNTYQSVEISGSTSRLSTGVEGDIVVLGVSLPLDIL